MEEDKKNIFSINKITKNDNDIKKRLREKKKIRYLTAPIIGKIYKMKKSKKKVGRPRKKPLEIFLESDDRTITTTGNNLNMKKRKISFKTLIRKNVMNISSRNHQKKGYQIFNPSKSYNNENKNSLVKKTNDNSNKNSDSDDNDDKYNKNNNTINTNNNTIDTDNNNEKNKNKNNNNDKNNKNNNSNNNDKNNKNNDSNNNEKNNKNNKNNNSNNNDNNNDNDNLEQIKNFDIEINENKSINSQLPLNFLHFKPFEKNNFEYIGNIEKDSPLRVADVLQNNDDPRSLYIEIEWKTRKNGIKPKNSTYTNKRIREKFPDFLLDFYEDSLFLSQKRHIELEEEIERKNKK